MPNTTVSMAEKLPEKFSFLLIQGRHVNIVGFKKGSGFCIDIQNLPNKQFGVLEYPHCVTRQDLVNAIRQESQITIRNGNLRQKLIEAISTKPLIIEEQRLT